MSTPTSSLADAFVEDQPPLDKFCPECEHRHPPNFNVCPTDGTELVDADELLGKTLAGTYIVTGLIGEGGMGRIYEARHTRIQAKKFAIKTLHPELGRVADYRARFEREANAAAAIADPHVVGVYDLGETPDGRPFFVSELLDGVELAEHLESEAKFETAYAVRIARQLCRALTAAHAVGAIHRDLKPANVFLTGDLSLPNAKVLDFGLAKFSDHPTLTKTGTFLGTPSYMAPEQAQGATVDHRVDIYGLGAILYAMLTGRPPHEGPTPAAIVISAMSKTPPAPRELEPRIPANLETVILRAMAKDPGDRFATAMDLETALAPFDEAEPAGDPRPAHTTSGVQGAASDAVLFGALGAAWLFLAMWNALVALGDMAADDRPGIGMVVLFAIVALMVVGVPGAALAVRIRDTAWRDAGRRPAIAHIVRTLAIAGGVVFGLGTLLMRFAELVLARGEGAAWPGWDLLLVSASLFAVALAALTLRQTR